MRGAKPKPDTIKIADGTFRKDRAKKNPPKSAGVPRCPFLVKSIAGKKWKEVVTGLKRMGLIDVIDSTHIEGLCKSYQVAKEADVVVKREGMVIPNAAGSLIKHPAVQISADAWHKVRMFCNDLGLNHLSRQRMESNQTTDSSSLEAEYFG